MSKTALELFEAAPCGYLFTEPDGTIVKVNETFLRWTGYSNEELVGKRFQELLSVPAAIFYETHFAPLLRMQGFVKEITVDIVCANGTTLAALVNSTIEADAVGVPQFVRTTVFDIRERRRYERELLVERRRAEQLASVVKYATDAIITANGELAVTTWNDGAQAMFGYTPEEAVGRDIRALIVPSEVLGEVETRIAALKSGQRLSHETTLRNKDGEPVAVSVTATPEIDPPDEFVGFSAILRDVRPRKRDEEAERSRQDLELANRLAHEINNPLQAVQNCLSILAYGDGAGYVQLAEQQLARVTQVVLDLVKLTKTHKDPNP